MLGFMGGFVTRSGERQPRIYPRNRPPGRSRQQTVFNTNLKADEIEKELLKTGGKKRIMGRW